MVSESLQMVDGLILWRSLVEECSMVWLFVLVKDKMIENIQTENAMQL